MRNISFALTTPQVRAQTKTETRRLGWSFLKPGALLMACEKCQGIARGGLVRLGPIRVESVRRERLDAITADAVAREGFPGMSPEAFIAMFCEHMGCRPETVVTVIEFSYVVPEVIRNERHSAFEDREIDPCEPVGRGLSAEAGSRARRRARRARHGPKAVGV